jgi:hypothetical protein
MTAPVFSSSDNTDRQASRLHADNLSRLGHRPHSEPEDLHDPRICGGGTTNTAEFDPMDEFKKGVELLKNECPKRPC